MYILFSGQLNTLMRENSKSGTLSSHYEKKKSVESLNKITSRTLSPPPETLPRKFSRFAQTWPMSYYHHDHHLFSDRPSHPPLPREDSPGIRSCLLSISRTTQGQDWRITWRSRGWWAPWAGRRVEALWARRRSPWRTLYPGWPSWPCTTARPSSTRGTRGGRATTQPTAIGQ